jgi:tetratricopeptide (TPR) repeat protein
VISRNSSFTFKGRHVDLPQVAQTLKVSHVLEGSVRRSGNRVRITAQLIDGATNNHVWAERYDRELNDIFALQDEISKAIVTALKLKLFPKEKKAIEDRGSTNVEAYDLYLRARALARTFAPLEILRAIEIYRQALALDPNFALAWAGLASALERALLNAPETQAETRQAMDDAFSRALALDPDGWTSQLARAAQLFARRDWAGAEHAFTRAIELAPASEPSVRMRYGAFLMHIGRVRESVDLLQSARRAEPLSLEVSTLLQIALDTAGMRAEALAEFERSKDLAGDRAMLEFFAFLRLLEHDDAARIKRQFIRFLSFENLILPVHQEMREVLDQPEAVLALLRRAHGDPACQDSTRQTILAEWAAHYGDFDLAFAAFRRALIDLTSTWYADFWRPHYAVARRDPRFKSLLRDLGLIDYYRSSGKWPDLLRPVGEDDFEAIG